MQLYVPMASFFELCLAVAAERVAELFWSRAHERRMGRRGGRVLREPAYAAMVAVHAGTLMAAPLEARLTSVRVSTPAARVVRGLAWGALGVATALRLSALRALGDSWSTRVTRFADGERRVVTSGPYRHIRHPNYLAVILELAALRSSAARGGRRWWRPASTRWCWRGASRSRSASSRADRRWREHFAPLPRFLPRVWRLGPRPQRDDANDAAVRA